MGAVKTIFFIVFLLPSLSGIAFGQNRADSLLTIPRDVMMGFLSEPSHYFFSAQEYLFKHDQKGAAADIHSAAMFMKLVAVDAVDEKDRGYLLGAHAQLQKLLDVMYMGQAISVVDLKPIFSEAYFSLAWHYHQKALNAWDERHIKETAQYMSAAVQKIEMGSSWVDYRLSTTSVEILGQIRDLSAKLLEDSVSSFLDVGNNLSQLGVEVGKFGTAVHLQKNMSQIGIKK